MASAYVGYSVVADDESRSHLMAVRSDLARANAAAQTIPELERRLAALRNGAPADGPYRRQSASEIERELSDARAARLDRKRLRLEESNLLRDMERERRSLEARGVRKTSLPMLENTEIAAPCNVSWADMDGDSDVRFCGKCMKEVFNLSMMSREEAEAVLHVSREKGLCVRLYRRHDGTVLTQNCSVGLGRQKFWKRTKGIASAGMIAAGLGMLAYGYFASHCTVERAGSMGAVSVLPPG